MAENAKSMSGSGKSFSDRFSLDFTKRLAQFDTPGGIAYAAADSSNHDQPAYGLVQNPFVPQREGPLKILLQKHLKSYVNCLGQGVMTVPDASGQVRRLVTVFERPMGPSLASAAGREKVSERFLNGTFLLNMIMALADLHNRELVHRAIRPSNIFFRDENSMDVMLGECVSAPPAMGQAPGYETIDRCDCLPEGRGEGDVSDDFFALGATIMSLVLGRDVGESANPSVLMAEKIDRGSYRSLAGSASVPDFAAEILRGLLVDNAENRWGIDELAQLVDGQSPKVSPGTDDWVLSKPVTFAGGNYSDRRALAQAFGEKFKQAAQYLRQETIAKWVTENMTAEVFTEKIESSLNIDGRESHPRPEAAKIARMCAYLDPLGPIRYNGFVIAVDGLGPVVAAGYQPDGAKYIEAAKELLGTDLFQEIIKIKVEHNPKAASELAPASWANGQLRSTRRGHGMERVLYEFNGNMPCLSPIFKDNWVRSTKGAIKSIDQLIGTGKTTGLFDEHVCGFCAAQSSGLDQVFGLLTSSDLPTGSSVSKVVDALGAIQAKVKTGPLPNLCDKLCENMRPAIKNMHYKPRREALAKVLDQVVTTGMLSQVSSQLKLSAHTERDEQEFSQAGKIYAHLDRERKQLKLNIEPTDPRAIKNGYTVASTLALVIMIMSVFVAAVRM